VLGGVDRYSVRRRQLRTFQAIDRSIIDGVRDAASDIDAKVGNDDIIDAFALALTASPKTGPVKMLPDEWPENDIGDPADGFPMEIVYAYQSGGCSEQQPL
jgi:predicted RNase H-like nuclease